MAQNNKVTILLTPIAPTMTIRADNSGESGAALGQLILRMMKGTGKVRLSKKEHLEYFHGVADSSYLRDATDVYEMLKKYDYIDCVSHGEL